MVELVSLFSPGTGYSGAIPVLQRTQEYFTSARMPDILIGGNWAEHRDNQGHSMTVSMLLAALSALKRKPAKAGHELPATVLLWSSQIIAAHWLADPLDLNAFRKYMDLHYLEQWSDSWVYDISQIKKVICRFIKNVGMQNTVQSFY